MLSPTQPISYINFGVSKQSSDDEVAYIDESSEESDHSHISNEVASPKLRPRKPSTDSLRRAMQLANSHDSMDKIKLTSSTEGSSDLMTPFKYDPKLKSWTPQTTVSTLALNVND